MSGLQQGALFNLLPSVGTYGYIPKVNYFFGFPSTLSPGGIEMDLPGINIVTATSANDPDLKRQYVQQLGTLSSALEHAVP